MPLRLEPKRLPPAMNHLTHADALRLLGTEVFIYRETFQYEGPVVLDRITKAGHCVVLSKRPLEPAKWPTKFINHKQGDRYRSTVKTYALAVRVE